MTEEDLKQIEVLLDRKLDQKLAPLERKLRIIEALSYGNRDSLVNINARLQFVEHFLKLDKPEGFEH